MREAAGEDVLMRRLTTGLFERPDEMRWRQIDERR